MKKCTRTAEALKKSIGGVMGIDLGDRYSHYAVVNSGGEIFQEGRVATRRESMETLLEGRARMRVVMETGTHSPWVSRVASAAGHEAIVANARKVQLITRNRKKGDKVDAAYLARLGRADITLLHPVRHRSERAQAHRAWLTARDAVVTSRTKLISYIRGVVKSLGYRLPVCSTEAFAVKAREHVPATLKSTVDPLFELIGAMTQAIRKYDQQIAAISRKHYPIVPRLQQIAGVGPLTALAYVLTIEDPHRFTRSRTVGAYLGLVPARHDSGEQLPQMHITKEGDVLLRRLLINCAQYVMGPFGPDCDLRRHGLQIAQRGGKIAKKRAVVAVARKIAVLLHKLWITQADYDPHFVSRRLKDQAA
jgi:transposase